MSPPVRVDRTVVVLGMHRSGTSVVAGILHALGVDMGAGQGGEAWVGRHWSNPTGHFEDPAFVDLDYRILGGDSTGIRGTPTWQEARARAPEFADEIEALVRRSERVRWGWKDPWTVLTIEAFRPHLRAPYFVVVHRPREEVLASLRKRSTARDRTIAALWDQYQERLESFRSTFPDIPRIDLEYAELLADPGETIDRLITFLGLRPTREEIDRALGMVLRGPALRRQGQRLAVRGVLGFPLWVGWIAKRDLRHNPRVLRSDLLAAVPKELYQMLRALV